MYERFFGLRERPFDLFPNPRFLYLSGRQREAISNLRYGLSTPRGLTLLLGEAGSGKTTLLQAVLGELDPGRIHCVLISNPTLTRTEFYEQLAAGFSLSERAACSKSTFLSELRAQLVDRAARGGLSALILDEAQSLPAELLEEVRLLSNMETSTTKLLNVVLAGQPEFAERLNEPALCSLKQRISLRCQLWPLDLLETASYIAGRIRIAGGTPSGIFTREAIEVMFSESGGLPRVINVICDNALIGGFAAQQKPVTRAIVEEVLEDFDLGSAPGERGHAGAPPPVRELQAPNDEPGQPGVESATPEPAPIFAMSDRKRRFSFF